MTHTKRATYFTDTDMRKCRTCGIEAHTADGLYHFVKDPRQKETSRRNQCKKCHNKRKDRSPKVKINMEFRGVLCNRCNISIGALGDTIESVQKALDYLKRDENGR